MTKTVTNIPNTETESFIPGKDASLETSIHTLQTQLETLGFHIEEHSWLNPVADVWSVHIRDRDCPLLFTNGKGSSKKAALASALGEFFERLSTNYFWADYYLGEAIAQGKYVHYPQEKWFRIREDGSFPRGMLNKKLLEFYNPEGTLNSFDLVDLNSGNRKRGVCTLPFTRQRDQKNVWFPVNLVGNLYVSNGMSAGNTATEARTQALSEIFERHIKFKIIAEGLCLPDVPVDVIERYPQIAAGIKALRDAGFGIVVKDASLGGLYPVMCVTLLNTEDQGCFASFGAHPRFEVALERALTELLQGRALEKLGGFAEPGFDLEEIASSENLETHFIDSSGIMHWDFLSNTPSFNFTDWNFSGTTEEEFNWLCDRIHALNFDIYIMDYNHLGVYACRVIVPGMSEIYAPEDLEWDNNNTGNPLREAILNLRGLDDATCAELRTAIDDMGLDDQQPVAALIGLAPDAGSLWEDLRIAELKLLLALIASDAESVYEGSQWIRHFEQLNPQRRKTYRLIETLLDMDNATPYREGLALLYGEDTLDYAKGLLSNDLRFWNVESPDLALAGCDMHQRLLAAYQKVHRAKAKG